MSKCKQEQGLNGRYHTKAGSTVIISVKDGGLTKTYIFR